MKVQLGIDGHSVIAVTIPLDEPTAAAHERLVDVVVMVFFESAFEGVRERGSCGAVPGC